MPDGTPLIEAAARPAAVRVAGPGDEEAIYDLLLEMAHEGGHGIPVSRDRVMALIRHGTRGLGGIVGVIDGPGGIVATIGLAMDQYWYSEAWYLREGWLYVRPEYRESHHYRDLFEFARWCAQRLGIEPTTGRPWQVMTSVWSSDRLDLKERLWSRFGKKIAAVFLMDA